MASAMNLATDPSSFPADLRAAVLAEALPYMRRYAGHTLVIKYGGHAMGGRDAQGAAIRSPATWCC